MTARASVDRTIGRFFELSVLGLVASGFLAVAGSGNLDLATIVLVTLALAVRGAMSAGWLGVLPARVAQAAALAAIAFFPADLRFFSATFLEATVHLVFLLAAVRVLSAQVTRDYVYAAALSVLELLAGALLSNQLNFFVFLGIYLLFAVAALASGEIRRAAAQPGQMARPARRVGARLGALAVCVTAGVLAMSGFLFFLLPRTATAALRHMSSHGLIVPGFSGQVTLGQIGEIKSNPTAVMHIRAVEAQPINGPLRLRGATLSEFDGRQWRNAIRPVATIRVPPDGLVILAGLRQQGRPGRRAGYQVDLKQLDTNTLFFAGTPEVLRISATYLVRSDDGSIRATPLDTPSVRYYVSANLDGDAGGNLTDMARYLALPPVDGRVEAMAREWTSGVAGVEPKALAIERELRTRYAYTLELPKEEHADPLGHFLFERRAGHCEYFASAMAVMLRTLGIPSRLVTGFYGGTPNPVSG